MSSTSTTHLHTVEHLRSALQSSYNTDSHDRSVSSSNHRHSATQWVFAAGALCAGAATLVLFANASNAQVLTVQPSVGTGMNPTTSLTAPRTAAIAEARGAVHAIARMTQAETGVAPVQRAAVVTPEVLPPHAAQSKWSFVTLSMAFLAIPIAVVYSARKILAKKVPATVDLFSIKSATEYCLMPEGVTDVVSLKGFNGCQLDMLANTPTYRVAMLCGPNVQEHIRFAVFALFERFNDKCVKVVMLAQEESRRSGHNQVGVEQLLLGIIGEGTGVAARILRSHGLDLKTARGEVASILGRGADSVGIEIPFTDRSKKVLETAQAEAQALGHNQIGTEHLLLAVLQENKGVAAKVFSNMSIEQERVRQALLQAIAETRQAEEILDTTARAVDRAPQGSGQKEQEQTSVLEEYTVDLTEKAKNGELDPVIGRHDEIERVIQILGRRTKNNPCLIGEPGVGKTAIAEGLAQMIVDGDVPENLADKQVAQLDLTLLVAGTKFRGEFEERLKNLLEEVKENGDIILVIDEVHTLVGAGAAEGAIDAANIMKPGLARGEYQVVGATTISEYRQHIEKDAALERRFQPAMVPEPTIDDCIEILHGVKHKYEAHHGLEYTDEAVVAAVKLAGQYINDRFLPDKAIDLLDEAGSCQRLAQSRKAPPLPEVQQMRKQVKQLKEEKAEALRTQDFESAAVVRKQIQELEEKMEGMTDGAEEETATDAKVTVTEEHIANIVSRWTGVPVEKVTKDEGAKLLNLEEKLHEKVIGQDEAVSGIARALRRARVGMKDPNRPIASMFFLGPTGVGKTQLAKALAAQYFGSEDAMIRLDMSEYMERHTVSKLIGSPPGYVGYDEGGQLTEVVRKKPYCLLLFDEIEKAHPDVFNMMLQILEDGRLTDSQGRVVNFKNTLIIMTSNVGSQVITRSGGGSMGFAVSSGESADEQSYQSVKMNVQEAMKASFKPEFLNRIDEVVVFRQLTKPQVRKVADVMLKDVYGRLATKGIAMTVSEKFKDKLLEHGWCPTYGARPLRRAINSMLEDALSECVLRGDVSEGDSIEVDVNDKGEIIVVGAGGVVLSTQSAPTVAAGIA